MSDPFLGEIRLFSFTRIPNGWLACDGSTQSIQTYQALYTLLGTTYGGNGSTTFGLPDLRGQLPIHQGTGTNLTPRVLGQTGGSESVTLVTANMPAHNHTYSVTNSPASSSVPTNTEQLGAAANGDKMYIGIVAAVPQYVMSPNANTGKSLPHDNLMPTLAGSFCIASSGIYPQQQ